MASGTPSHSTRKGRWGSVFRCQKIAPATETPPIALTPSYRKGHWCRREVPPASLFAIMLSSPRADKGNVGEIPKAIAVFLCTTSGRDRIWSTSPSLSLSLSLIRVLVLGKKLVMYSCIYDKNKSPMSIYVHRTQSYVDLELHNLTIITCFSCPRPVT